MFQENLKKIENLLIDDIAFFRDLNNDFPEEGFRSKLIDILEKEAINLFKIIQKYKEGHERVRVGVIGNFSSGKSTFINSLLGENVCPTAIRPTTSCITQFVYSDVKEVFLITDENKFQKISIEKYHKLVEHTGESSNIPKIYKFEYRYPAEILRNIILFDTPGFENPQNPYDEKITEEILFNETDVVLFIQDINQPDIGEKTRNRINKLKKEKPEISWYFILNKAEEKSNHDIKEIVRKIKEDKFMQETFEKIFVYSSKSILTSLEAHTKEIERIKDILFNAIKNKIDEIMEKSVAEETIYLTVSFKTGEKERRRSRRRDKKIILTMDENSIELPSNLLKKEKRLNFFVEIREKILEEFKRIFTRKNEIFKSKLNKKLKFYLQQRAEILQEIESEIKKKIENILKENDEINAKLLKAHEKFIREVEKIATNKKERIERELKKHIISKEIEGSGWLFFSNNAIIWIDKDFFVNFFASLKYDLTKLNNYWKESFNLAFNEDLRNILEIVSYSQIVLLKHFINMSSNILERESFSNIESAKENYQKFIYPLLKETLVVLITIFFEIQKELYEEAFSFLLKLHNEEKENDIKLYQQILEKLKSNYCINISDYLFEQGE